MNRHNGLIYLGYTYTNKGNLSRSIIKVGYTEQLAKERTSGHNFQIFNAWRLVNEQTGEVISKSDLLACEQYIHSSLRHYIPVAYGNEYYRAGRDHKKAIKQLIKSLLVLWCEYHGYYIATEFKGSAQLNNY